MANIETTHMNGSEAADVAADVANEAGDLIGRISDRAATTYAAARDMAQQVDPFVKERPYVALGLAILAGLIIGGLFLPRGPRVIYVKPAG